jgi:hypothetical protein
MKREGAQKMNVSCDTICRSKVYVAEGKKIVYIMTSLREKLDELGGWIRINKIL